jgi:molecular chaperone GrpE
MKEEDVAMTKNKPEAGSEAQPDMDIEELQKSLAEEKEKAEKYLDNWKRAEADFSNYRKRSDQEKSDITHNTTCSVILGLLPVLDDFERALATVPAESAKMPWLEGINLIYKKMKAAFESLGVEEMCSIGEQFEPSVHEAMAQVKGKEGEVIAELQKGYKIKGKLLRASKVLVGKGDDGE